MPPPTVLCAITDDDRRDDVIATGRALHREGGYRLLFAHVATSPATPHGALASGPPAPYRGQAWRFVEECRLGEHEATVVRGDPAAELVRLGRDREAAAIVIGTRGRGLLSGVVLGRVCRAVVSAAGRPVLITRPGTAPLRGGPVVCALDPAQEDPLASVERAAELAARAGRRLVLVHAQAADGTTPLERLRDIGERLPVDDVECLVLDATPHGTTLEAFAARRGADVLVVGSRGGGVVHRRTAGGRSHDAIRRGRTPVLVVPS
jgi:nucleotide-binding universal stress UspA family protein